MSGHRFTVCSGYALVSSKLEKCLVLRGIYLPLPAPVLTDLIPSQIKEQILPMSFILAQVFGEYLFIVFVILMRNIFYICSVIAHSPSVFGQKLPCSFLSAVHK